MIVVTHAEEVARLAVRRVRLRDGRVVGLDAPPVLESVSAPPDIPIADVE